jgi:RNA polymerase sigma factor (sigma-70 family)
VVHTPIEEIMLAAPTEGGVDLIALDDALNRLAVLDPQQAQIVELRYFSGFSIEDTADVLGISPSTVKREWRAAKAWLRHQLTKGDGK